MFQISPEDENAKSTTDLKYMRYLRFHLCVINMWPKQEVGTHGQKHLYKTYFLIFQSIFLGILLLIYIYNNVGKLTFFEIGHNYITISLNIVYLPRIVMPLFQRYINLSNEFTTKIHLFNHKQRSAYAMKTHIAVHRISYGFTVYQIASMLSGLALFNITPMYNNYSSGMFDKDRPQNSTTKYEHAVYFVLPFDTDTSLKGYIILNIFNWYLSYFLSIGVCIVDLYLYLMVFHLWGHFKILLHDLETFPRPHHRPRACDKPVCDCNKDFKTDFSLEETPFIHEKLNECLEYHVMLKTFVQYLSTVFGPILFVNNLFHTVVICLLLLECSQLNPEALARYGPLTIIIFLQLIQMSSVMELVGTSNEKLKGAVYNLPWECMDKSCRLKVLMLLMKVQAPVQVKALGMVSIGVTNMAQILKTSFSYFTFLRAVAE